MGISVNKFLNTSTHFSVETWYANSDNISLFNNSVNHFPIGGSSGAGRAVEADVQLPFDGAFTITRMKAHMFTNSLTVAGTLDFRAGGVSVASVAIPNTGALDIDSGVINVNVASGALCNIRVNLPIGAGFIDLGVIEITVQRAIA